MSLVASYRTAVTVDASIVVAVKFKSNLTQPNRVKFDEITRSRNLGKSELNFKILF